jgi:hypothetical protein
VPLRFVFDEHLRGPLWRAIQRHNARGDDPIDAVRVGDLADLPLGTSDPTLLVWAEREGRILVTSDKTTMPQHLQMHLAAGRRSPGVFLLRPDWSLRAIVSFLVLAAYASEPEEWQDRLEYVPLAGL